MKHLIHFIEFIAHEINEIKRVEGEQYNPELEKAFLKLFMAVTNLNGRPPFTGTRN